MSETKKCQKQEILQQYKEPRGPSDRAVLNALKRLENGDGVCDVARSLGISPRALHGVRKELGGSNLKRFEKEIEEKERIAKLQDLSIKEEPAVRAIFGTKEKKPVVISPQHIQWAIEEYAQGTDPDDIIYALGIDQETWDRWLVKFAKDIEQAKKDYEDEMNFKVIPISDASELTKILSGFLSHVGAPIEEISEPKAEVIETPIEKEEAMKAVQQPEYTEREKEQFIRIQELEAEIEELKALYGEQALEIARLKRQKKVSHAQ